MMRYPIQSTNPVPPKKRFNLRRYFSYYSISIIMALTILLSSLVYWNQRETLIQYSISSTKDFARQLNYRLHDDFFEDNLSKYGYLNIDDYRKVDDIAKIYLADYKDIIKLKIYNLSGKIIYSTEHDNIGVFNSSEDVEEALQGKVSTELTQHLSSNMKDISESGKKYNMDLLEVYAPIYQNPGSSDKHEIAGVFEIYKDVSPIFTLMRREFYKVPLLLVSAMSLLYLFLQIVIKKADAIINKQNEEMDLHNAELMEAQKRIRRAIEEVIDNESFHVRLQCDNLLKCWEVKKCEHVECPSYKSENLRCWQVAGTFCGGKVQGIFANKYGDCRKCEIFQNAFKDRISMIGESFNNMMALLQSKHLELQKLNERLNVLIDTDPLTEIGNRRSFQKRMDSIHQLSLRYNHPYSIIICDVDNFKIYNDTYGHQKGDYALISISKTMKTSIRRTDEIFRWGGEEFIIILPQQNMMAALKVAESLRMMVEQLGITHTGATSKILTVSVGVASNIADNVKYISWESVVKQADDELYKAKAAGKNRIYPAVNIRNISDEKS